MTADSYTIGEFARLTGLSEKALRIYDEKDLLTPVEIDSKTGYRRYATDQIPEGQLIAMLRAIDMPLAEVAHVLNAPDSARSALVRRYWYRVERQIDESRAIVRQLHHHNEEREYGVSHTDAAMTMARSKGAFAAIAQLAGIADIEEAANAYGEAMKTAYWQEKDTALVTAICYAGVDHLFSLARCEDPEAAYQARSSAKALMYNLASFTWVGWDEPDIAVSPSDAAAGLAAARMNLTMALDLEKGDLAISRAYWMLGAHLLTAGHHGEAIDAFNGAIAAASGAGADVEGKLSEAFAALTGLAADREGAAQLLDASLDELRSMEKGADFADQVETARSVLGI